MTPYGPQQPPDEQAMALPNPQPPASLSTFQLPQPQMPDLQGPGPAAPPTTLGGLPGAAPLPTEGNRIALLRAEIERQVAANQEKAEAQRRAFEESMKTSSLERYLPKPSARQMLSDALANIGMAHLTKGNFTPIQQRRFDEALKAHGAEVESRKLALDAANSSANQLNQSLTQVRLAEALAEREANNQAKQAQAASETARKAKNDETVGRIRQGLLDVQRAMSGPKEAQLLAQARLSDAMAGLTEGGGNNIVAAATALSKASGLPEGSPEYVKHFEETLGRLKDATTRFNPNAGSGLVGSFQEDSEGNKHFVVGDKKTKTVSDTLVDPPKGGDGASWAKLTTNTRTMVEKAPTVIGFVDSINKILDDQEKSLGPGSSRMREFMAGKIGAKDKEFTALRSNVILLTTNLMNMHVGARGSEKLLDHFKELIDHGKQDPENMRSALKVIKQYAEEKMKHGGMLRNTPNPNPGSGKSGRPPLSQFEVKQ